MNHVLETDSPRLQPPGAGLPKPELFVARALFTFLRWRSSKTACTLRFQQERSAIHQLLAKCNARSGAQRVLIKRLPGLEDSSRFWSVWMTLDHLRIIHGSFTQIIETLMRGDVLEGKANTAAVKPGTDVTEEVVGPYETSCDDLLAVAAAVPHLKTGVRFTHPWFGSLDAAGWYALAGMHLGIHRQQIERIIAGREPHFTRTF